MDAVENEPLPNDDGHPDYPKIPSASLARNSMEQ